MAIITHTAALYGSYKRFKMQYQKCLNCIGQRISKHRFCIYFRITKSLDSEIVSLLKIAIAHPNIITVSIKARFNKHFENMLKNAKITLDKCL